ncbi:MAG: flagellar hook-basal body complex protein FliE [Rickettsiaceae bacterium]|nr:flagellar hook-basal body complex protein FliE [Rickettsiaceae bacterium]
MSSINSINLEAMNAYNQVSAQKITPNPEIAMHEVSNFQKIMEVNFNKLATLTPEQILSRIHTTTSARNQPAYTLDISSNIASSLSGLRKTLIQQETEAKKAGEGQANIIELMTSTTKATNLLSAFVAVKDAAKESWEKIWSMSL